MLLNIGQSELAVGFENSSGTEDYNAYLARNAVDKLLALAEALGCLPVQCPEQGEWGYPSIDLDALRGSGRFPPTKKIEGLDTGRPCLGNVQNRKASLSWWRASLLRSEAGRCLQK